MSEYKKVTPEQADKFLSAHKKEFFLNKEWIKTNKPFNPQAQRKIFDLEISEDQTKRLTVSSSVNKINDSGLNEPIMLASNSILNVRTSYNIEIETESGETVEFKYYTSFKDRIEAKELKKDDLDFALYCFLSDAEAGNKTLDEFASEFGYDDSKMKISEIIKIHKACKDSLFKAHSMGLTMDNIYSILRDLQENYKC
jgi:hypothetical protein